MDSKAELKQALIETAIVLMRIEDVADSLELYDVHADIEAASALLMAGALKIIQAERLESEGVQEDHGND